MMEPLDVITQDFQSAFPRSARMAAIVRVAACAVQLRTCAHLRTSSPCPSLADPFPAVRRSQQLLPGCMEQEVDCFVSQGEPVRAPVLLSPNYLALYPSSSGHLRPSSVNQITLYRKLEALCDILAVSKMLTFLSVNSRWEQE